MLRILCPIWVMACTFSHLLFPMLLPLSGLFPCVVCNLWLLSSFSTGVCYSRPVCSGSCSCPSKEVLNLFLLRHDTPAGPLFLLISLASVWSKTSHLHEHRPGVLTFLRRWQTAQPFPTGKWAECFSSAGGGWDRQPLLTSSPLWILYMSPVTWITSHSP